MNDKFAADLRQHLLSSANERPADGQLASVMDAVGAARQRLPLVARLTQNPGRIGAFPAQAVRFGLIAAALALAMAAGALLAGRPGPTTVFEGTWTSTDPLDRSAQILVVGPGDAPDVYFEDGWATGGACDDDVVKRFTAHGTGTISGNTLNVDFPEGGGCGSMIAQMVGFFFEFRPGDNVLVGHDELEWTRALDRAPRSPDPSSPQASASPDTASMAPTTAPGEATFSSAVHGISIDYPNGWQTRPATEPWSGQTLGFDSPEADVIFDPAHGDGLYLLLASEPYGGLTPHEWTSMTIDRLCAGSGGSGGSWTVDGVSSWAFTCGGVDGIVIPAAERGYLIRVIVNRANPTLAGGYDWDWLRPRLDSVDLRPAQAVGGPTPTAACTEFRDAGTYVADWGQGLVTVAVPASADDPWHGLPYRFSLLRGACLSDGPSIEVMSVGYVSSDACQRADSEVSAERYDAAMAALSTQTGHTPITPTSTSVAGYPASVFAVTAPADAASCVLGVIGLFDGVMVAPGATVTVYVVDVQGWAVAIAIHGNDDGSLTPQFEAIVASMDINAPAP